MAKKNIRKAKRSGTQECDMCGERTSLVKHHIHGRDIPNPEKPSNLVWMCPNCHDKVHIGRILIVGWFETPVRTLFWHYDDEPSPLPEYPSIQAPSYD